MEKVIIRIEDDFIIETKGRANESFPMRWKLFKRLVMTQFPNVTLYKPQNQKECDETVDLILKIRSLQLGSNTKNVK